MEKKVVVLNELTPVKSSNIGMVGYDETNLTTYVQFNNGGIYAYPQTTREEYESLIKADSVGSHFSKSYKNKQDFEKLESTVLKKNKLSEDELLAQVSAALRKFSLEKMQTLPTTKQADFSKALIELIKKNI